MLVTKFTEFEKSNKDFDVSTTSAGKVTCLNKIEKLVNFHCVTCYIKVLSVEKPMEVPGGKRKQDIIVANGWGKIKLTM